MVIGDIIFFFQQIPVAAKQSEPLNHRVWFNQLSLIQIGHLAGAIC